MEKRLDYYAALWFMLIYAKEVRGVNAKEVSKMTGVSVRALHHYDAMSILSPGRNPENGYREYSDDDLDKLQQILFFRKCGFPLVKIREFLSRPDFDREKAFEMHRKYLLRERERIDLMLETLEKTAKNLKGGIVMSNEDKFGGFDFTSNPYEDEARQLWGDEMIDRSNAHIKSHSQREQEMMAKAMDDLFAQLADIRFEAPASEIAQKAMDKMFKHFNYAFGVTYSPEAFAGIGRMYVEDERFTVNVDKYGEGLANFLAEAMGIYAQSRE